MAETYSFCESVHAINWHIRVLSVEGPKFGGGADTDSLCGLQMAWDTKAPFSSQALFWNKICRGCTDNYAVLEVKGDG